MALATPPPAPTGPLLPIPSKALAFSHGVSLSHLRLCLAGLAVDIGVLPAEMPEAMVPWACTFYKGDSVTITDHRHRAMLGAPPTPPAKVRIPRTIWTKEFMEETYEAGPWIGNSTPFGHSSAMSIG